MAVFTRRTAQIRLARIKFDTIDFGLINNVKLTLKPIELGRDAFGRTITNSFDFKLEFNLFANDNASMKELCTIARDHGTGTVYITGYGGDVQIPGLLMRFEPELNFDGKASAIKVIFDRYLTEDEAISIWLAAAATTPPTPGIETVIDGNSTPTSSFLTAN